MKKMACPNCGAKLLPSESERFVHCQYCGSSFHNEYYDENAAPDESMEETAEEEEDVIYLEDVAIEYLVELGEQHEVNDYSEVEFGTPLTSGKKHDAARKYFGSLPEDEEIYLVYDATIFGSCKKGFALCQGGFYYETTIGSGHFSWEEFIDNEISYSEDYTLTINGVKFTGVASLESFFDFLIEFHDAVFDDWYEEE